MASLNDVWPEFLDRLDRQPQRAARELYEFSFRLVQVAPPAVYRSLPHDIAVDVLYDIVASLLQDNFARLRCYQNEGRPFAVWLRQFVRERSDEWIRRLHAESAFPTDQSFLESNSYFAEMTPAERTRTLHNMRNALDSLDCLSRLVLEMSADELKPWEIARVLRCPNERTRDIKAEIESSRRAFKQALKKNGIDLDPATGSTEIDSAPR